jgi:ferredoxin-NADP reductase
MIRILLSFLAVGLLTACAERIYAPDEAVAAARYSSSDAPYISLMTMVERDNNEGAHSAILVNGSQVALYDPAGTFKHPELPERNDVFYGITPRWKEVYEWYHARKTTYVVEHRLPVSRAFADQMIARMETQGPSPKMFCGINTSEILRSFDVFSDIPRSFYPDKIMKAFAQLPGVTERRVYQEDSGQNIQFKPDT